MKPTTMFGAALQPIRTHLSSGVSVALLARMIEMPFGEVLSIAIDAMRGQDGATRLPKIPRGKGYDQASLKRLMKELETGEHDLVKLARAQRKDPDMLYRLLAAHFPERWGDWIAAFNSHPPLSECGYCRRPFVASKAGVLYCSSRCASQRREDDAYFGGVRREALGLAEGVCQLCRQDIAKGMQAHHVYGKANDEENRWMVALCRGCHELVENLANRTFLDSEVNTEALLNFAAVKRRGGPGAPQYNVTIVNTKDSHDLPGPDSD